MRAEWLQTSFVFGAAAKEELPYGLRSPRNATRGLLSVVQGFILKHLLFARKMGRATTSEYVSFLGGVFNPPQLIHLLQSAAGER